MARAHRHSLPDLNDLNFPDPDETGPRHSPSMQPGPTDVDASLDSPSDWGSLVADLSPGRSGPTWKVHDRTHLELAVDYPMEAGQARSSHEWEAYFFAPESLRLESKNYGKTDIYNDLQSYVRFAVPEVALGDLTGTPLDSLRERIAGGDSHLIVRELRLFACHVRSAGVHQSSSIMASLRADRSGRERGLAATARMVVDCHRLTSAFRRILAELPDDDNLATAAVWVDEDVSRVIETLLGTLATELTSGNAPEALVASVTEGAVAEARYRTDQRLGGVGRAGATKREVEHLEFRRHVLKRFTSSVLWLKPEVRDGARYVLEVLYAIAAGVAMTFAIVATILNGDPRNSDRVWMWAAFAIAAYMGKDRIKASLQSIFSKLVSRHFPDRRWRIRDRERGVVLGEADEQSAFVPFDSLPEDVLELRRATRKHPFEEQARPERVLWHRKVVRLDAERVAEADPRFNALSEIFRLDLRRWLAHTDDPKRKIVFADPNEGRVFSAIAPRVYNIGVVYRLRACGDEEAPWHRIRVVVTRKGIRRIDRIA